MFDALRNYFLDRGQNPNKMALSKVRLAVEKDVMSVEKCLKDLEENNTAVHIDEDRLRSLAKRVQNVLAAVQSDKLKVVFLGKTGTGKSSIINALLREGVLPSGYGRVTRNVCSIEGVVDPTSRATVLDMISGHQEDYPLPLKDMVNGTSKIIQVFYPQEKCPLLGEGVVLFDTPGMNADEEMDDFLKKTCSDADVFVYVCDGTCTIENAEKEFLVRIKHILSNLTSNNLFILFNWWDVVCSEENASEVRSQHLTKSRRFLVDEFGFEQESVKNSIFFISAKEVLAIHQETANVVESDLSFQIKNRFSEFESFENRLKECLTTHGVETRFGRHRDSVRSCSEEAIAILEKTKWVVDEKRKCAESAKKIAEKKLAVMKDAVVDFEREIEEHCHSAVGKFNQKFDKTVAELTLTLSKKAYNFLGDFVYDKEDDYKNDLLHQLQSEVHKANGNLHRELKYIYDGAEKVLKEGLARRMDVHVEHTQLHGLPYFTIEVGKIDISSAIGFVGFFHFLCSFRHWSKLGGLKTVAFLVSIIMAFFFSLFGVSVAMFCLLPATVTSCVAYKALAWYWSGFKKDAVTNLVLKCLIDEIDDQKRNLRHSCCRKMTESLRHLLGECRTAEKVETLSKDLKEKVEEVELLSKQAQQIIDIIWRLQSVIS